MNSIGVFREKEIDEKQFLIFTLLSQTDSPTSFSSSEAAIDSGGNDPSLQPLFLCPSLRVKVEKLKRKDEDSFILLPINTSPHFPNIGSTNQQVQYLLDSDSHDENDICKLPVVPLFWCNNKEPHRDEFECGACYTPTLGAYYYFCHSCAKMFHKECVESPLEIKHPSFSFLSLQLYHFPICLKACIRCEKNVCNIFYYFPTHNLYIHPVCAMKPIPFVIDHQKRHPHSLFFFPKQASLLCDVCGLITEIIPTYVCVRCVFVVHEHCIYIPHVIRISRHHHRISSTASLPSGEWSCGICRQKVNINCGAYSCNKCSDCFVHTRCALRKDVWDKKDLEGIPEEPEIDIEPFKRIDDGIILHFSHGHYLKLEISRVYDEDKYCQACMLPIYEDTYYSCMDQCDFILHETCADAPRKKYHALHPHQLTLKVCTSEYNNSPSFKCDACLRISCGYVYENYVGRHMVFKLDLQCSSVSEPFQYQGHDHPLFLSLEPEEERSAICQICQEECGRKLNCIECDYIICFKCATLPYKARYKHDKHFLKFSKAKEASDDSGWCEVCESKIVYSREGGFYACGDCCTTLHVDCLLGIKPYMKPGKIFLFHEKEVQILRNNTQTRPFCCHHEVDRCTDIVVYKKENMTFCSISCMFRVPRHL